MIELGVLLFSGLCFVLWKGASRGKVFVQSVLFLEALDCGDTVDEANKSAATFGDIPELDGRSIERADLIRRTQFGGKQLPVIAMARKRGFIK